MGPDSLLLPPLFASARSISSWIARSFSAVASAFFWNEAGARLSALDFRIALLLNETIMMGRKGNAGPPGPFHGSAAASFGAPSREIPTSGGPRPKRLEMEAPWSLLLSRTMAAGSDWRQRSASP